MKSKRLFHHTFKNNNVIEITDRGFSLWDDKDGRWVIDASCVVEDGYFSVMDVLTKETLKFDSMYPVKKKRGKRR